MEIFWYPAKRTNDAANSENSNFVLGTGEGGVDGLAEADE